MAKRVLFLWARYSGYMAACWKSLSEDPDWDVTVISISSSPGDLSDPSFDTSVMDGVESRFIAAADASSYEGLQRHLASLKPDLVVLSGWQYRGYLQAIQRGCFRDCPVILCSDNPIRHTWRQRIGIIRVRWLLRRAVSILVPGERGFQLMKYWKVPDDKIVKGLYGVDEKSLEACITSRSQRHWPRNFIFTGRYCPRKGFDVLLEAYAKYRQSSNNPWGLLCCGRGELQSLISSFEGVQDFGFVQPDSLPEHLSDASAFVLASRSDAWPLSLVEAALSGLPIICTSACGSSAELVRDLFNGRIVPPCNVDELADAMSWMQQQSGSLVDFGRRSHDLAMPYTSSQWAVRCSDVFHRALETITIDETSR